MTEVLIINRFQTEMHFRINDIIDFLLVIIRQSALTKFFLEITSDVIHSFTRFMSNQRILPLKFINIIHLKKNSYEITAICLR